MVVKPPGDAVRILKQVPERISFFMEGADDQIESLIQLYAEPTDVRHPGSPDMAPLLSQSALRSHFQDMRSRFAARSWTVCDLKIHQTSDPEVAIAEFVYQVRNNETERRIPCVLVSRVRNGRIIESKDYVLSPR